MSQKIKVSIAEIARQLPIGTYSDQFLPLTLMSPGRLKRLNFEPSITIRPMIHITKPVRKMNLPVLSGSNIRSSFSDIIDNGSDNVMIRVRRRYHAKAPQAEKHCQIYACDKTEYESPKNKWFACLE